MSTNNLNLTSISSIDASKESIINENFFTLDSLILIKALSIISSISNLSSKNGDVYLVSSSPDLAILDYANHLVIYHANFGYRFISAQEKMVLFVISEHTNYVFENGVWVKIDSFGSGAVIDDATKSDKATYSSDKIENLLIEKINTLDAKKSNSDSVLYKTNNLLELSDKAKSRDNLEVYSKYDLYTKTEVENYVKNYSPYKNDILYKENNGSDILDKAVFLENIGTYSKAAIDSKISNVSLSGAASFVIGDYKNSAQAANHGSWLLCKGGAISRATYANLYSLIGTKFGVGDGSTTFNLPDFSGCVFGATGVGGGLTQRNLGDKVGEEAHILTIDEIPSHTHSYTRAALNGGGGAGISADNGLAGQINNYSQYINNTGGGKSHNNMQPTLFGGNIFIFSGV